MGCGQSRSVGGGGGGGGGVGGGGGGNLSHRDDRKTGARDEISPSTSCAQHGAVHVGERRLKR